MATIATLAQAKAHLRIPTDETAHDADIQLKLDQAEDIILGYLKAEAGTDARNVQASILLILGLLYEHRGDDQTLSEATWTAVERLLVGLRDPALA